MTHNYPSPGTVVQMQCSRCDRVIDYTIPARASNLDGPVCDCGASSAVWWSKGHLRCDGYLYPAPAQVS